MRVCILDGREIKDREMLHDVLASALGFPDWYGRNLDALYDCLTDAGEGTEICLLHENALVEHLGGYTKALVKVMEEAAAENPGIIWKKED